MVMKVTFTLKTLWVNLKGFMVYIGNLLEEEYFSENFNCKY